MALRAGSVGLGSEAGLGSRRGWRSGRPGASSPPAVRIRCGRRRSPAVGASGRARWRAVVSRCLSGRRRGRGSRRVPEGRAAVGAAVQPARGRPSVRRGRATAAGGDSGRAPGPTRGSPQLRYPPRARPSLRRGAAAPAGCLGWRLAADLELVRTRGIRLFN